MRYALLIILLACAYISPAQTTDNPAVAKQIEIVGNDFPANSKAFFVSEIYAVNSNDFKFELLKYLLARNQIKHVVLEMSSAQAYLINQYMQTGDTTYRNYYFTEKLQCDEPFARFRALYNQHPFTVHGIDVEGPEFVAVVQNILSASDMAKKTALYKYVTSMIDSVKNISSYQRGYEQRTEIYKHAKKLFEQDEAALAASTFDKFVTLSRIFTNSVSEKHLGYRNLGMLTNLEHITKLGDESFVCILGPSASYLHDRLSVLSVCLKKHPENTVVINMICKNCDIDDYSGIQHTELSARINFPKISEQLDAAYDISYKPHVYSLIEQHTIKGLEEHYIKQPTYYVLFKDQLSKK